MTGSYALTMLWMHDAGLVLHCAVASKETYVLGPWLFHRAPLRFCNAAEMNACLSAGLGSAKVPGLDSMCDVGALLMCRVWLWASRHRICCWYQLVQLWSLGRDFRT